MNEWHFNRGNILNKTEFSAECQLPGGQGGQNVGCPGLTYLPETPIKKKSRIGSSTIQINFYFPKYKFFCDQTIISGLVLFAMREGLCRWRLLCRCPPFISLPELISRPLPRPIRDRSWGMFHHPGAPRNATKISTENQKQKYHQKPRS